MLAAVRAGWAIGEQPVAWWLFSLLALALSLVLWRTPAGPPDAPAWLRLAALSILLAAMFWAANQGLDLIKPMGSRRHDAASTVGGFELWQLLCPGLTVVALAGFVRSFMLRKRDPSPRA